MTAGIEIGPVGRRSRGGGRGRQGRCRAARRRRRGRCRRSRPDRRDDEAATVRAAPSTRSRSARATSRSGWPSSPGLVAIVARRRRRRPPPTRTADRCRSSRRSRSPHRSRRRTRSSPAPPAARHADRRRHRPDGPDHRRDRRAAGADGRPVAARRACAGSRSTATRSSSAPLTTYTDDPAVGRLSRAPAGPRRGRGHDRGGPDPEPRHARRQHRQRLAGRRHAAGSPRARRVDRRRRAARRADDRRAEAFWVAYRRTALAPDELILRVRIPIAGGPRGPLPEDRDAARAGDQQGRPRPRLARRRSPAAGVAGRTSGSASGSVADRPIRAPRGRSRPRGRPPDPGDRRRGRRGARRRDPPDRRRPLDRRLPPGGRRASAPPDDPRRRRLVTRG